MTLRLCSNADMDFAESVLYYITEESPQSAERFTNRLEITYREIIESPRRGRVVEYGLREKKMKGFPYSVFYSIEGEEIVVVAIYHDDRDRAKLGNRI